MVLKFALFIILVLGLNKLTAQEIIRYPSNNSEEQDSIITKFDSTAKPPRYKNGEIDFLYYLETFLGRQEWENYFNPVGDIITFEFIVKSDGRIDNFKIINSTNLNINFPLRQAIDRIDRWEPRIKEGKNVSTLMVYSLNIRSITEFPYIEIRKETNYEPTEPANRYLKWFLITGAVLVMTTLLILRN